MLEIPEGYTFVALQAGFKYTDRLDLGLILSDRPAAVAGVFTTNRFQAAPVVVARELLAAGQTARAIAVNAGQANACTGIKGIEVCRRSLELMAEGLGLPSESVLPASTGVIGASMDLGKWEQAAARLCAHLEGGSPVDVAKAMTTTDTFPKLAGRRVNLSGGAARILGMAKGAGMICPNMATMLCFLVTDIQVGTPLWRRMLAESTGLSFNRISIDGDTSTNDCVLGLANGASGVQLKAADEQVFQEALTALCRELAYLVVQDAEGGTKVIRIRIRGAADDRQAEAAARTVAHSPLVKTALFGQDPNWGRIVAALGRSGAEFDPHEVAVSLSGQLIFTGGEPVDEDLDALLAPYMERQEILLEVDLGNAGAEYEMLTSDLSTEYVRINADYRS